MSAPAFTPAPWRLLDRQDGAFGYRLEGGPDEQLIEYLDKSQFIDEREDPEQEANCRLIAAAPELYEALDAIMSERWRPEGRSEAVSDMARAALAKARADHV